MLIIYFQDMNSLTSGIESVIKNAIEEYVNCISQKYENIEVDDLENIWNDVSKTMKISVSFRKATESSHIEASTPSKNVS